MTLLYIAFLIPLVPALLSLWKWPAMDRHQKWFAVMIWFIVVVSFSGRIWTKIMDESNMPFYYIYILGEYLMLIQIFRLMFEKAISTKVWNGLAIGFSTVWIYNILTGDGWWAFPDYIRGLEAIVILVLVVLWFLKMLREKKILNPQRTFEFWMCAGLLIFFSGNMLVFFFSHLLLDAGKEVFEAIWEVNSILIIILYLLYSIAILWVKRTVKS